MSLEWISQWGPPKEKRGDPKFKIYMGPLMVQAAIQARRVA